MYKTISKEVIDLLILGFLEFFLPSHQSIFHTLVWGSWCFLNNFQDCSFCVSDGKGNHYLSKGGLNNGEAHSNLLDHFKPTPRDWTSTCAFASAALNLLGCLTDRLRFLHYNQYESDYCLLCHIHNTHSKERCFGTPCKTLNHFVKQKLV